MAYKVTSMRIPLFFQCCVGNTEYIRNKIHTNLKQKNNNVKQPSLSTCKVYCGYQLENVFFKSQVHEHLIRGGMIVSERKAQETLTHEKEKLQTH